VISVSGVVLGAWYMLWLVERVFFGPLREPSLDHGHAGDAHAAHVAAPAAHHAASDDHGHAHHDDHGHGPPPLPPSSVRDLSLREILALAPLVVFMFWIGLHPQFFTERMSPTLDPIALSASERFENFYRVSAAPAVAAENPAPESGEPIDSPAARLISSPPPQRAALEDSPVTGKPEEEFARVD
jgi:hypothetical protein